MLNVIHVVWSSGIGGIESLVLNLCVEQSRNSKIRVALFTAKSGGQLTDAAKLNNITLYEGDFNKGSSNLKSYNKCVKLFENFDVIHIHSFNPIIAYAAIRSKKKIVYTEHGNFGFERKISWSEKINRKFLSYFINNNIHFISFNSKFTQSTAKLRYGLKNTPSNVIYNGIPYIKSQQHIRKISNIITIGTVGRLAEVKRTDRLIDAFAAISQIENYNLEIVGDGPLRKKLEKITAQNNLTEQIKFEGFKSKLDNYFNTWDLAVIPSSGEAFGLVVIEAYSCGLPVAIFSDGGGMTEIVNLVDPELIVSSVEELTKLLNKLPNLKESLLCVEKQEKRKKIAQSFSISKMEKEFYSTYISL